MGNLEAALTVLGHSFLEDASRSGVSIGMLVATSRLSSLSDSPLNTPMGQVNVLRFLRYRPALSQAETIEKRENNAQERSSYLRPGLVSGF